MARIKRRAEVAFEQLVRVEAEERDAIAGYDSFGKQTEGEPLDALAELGVGEASFPADHAGLPAEKINSPIERPNWRQRYVHDLAIVSGDPGTSLWAGRYQGFEPRS